MIAELSVSIAKSSRLALVAMCGVQCARYVAKTQSKAEELEAQVRKQMEEDQAVNCFVGRAIC